MDQFATHIPLLAAAAAHVVAVAVRGRHIPSILELGVGEYSTPMLHKIVRACGGHLVSLDADGTWLAKFADLDLAYDLHELCQVDDWAACELIDQGWDLAFVDHGPTERRRFDLERVLVSSGIVVVHDTEPNTAYGFDQVLPGVRYQHTCKRWPTWTTICSMTVDVTRFGGER